MPKVEMLTEEKVIRYQTVYENSLFEVKVVKYPDMPACVYGVINRATNVIEGLYPSLLLAQTDADDSQKQLGGGPKEDKKEGLGILKSVTKDETSH